MEHIIDLWEQVAGGQLFRSHADREFVEAYIPPAGQENHAPNFAPVIDPTLQTGIETMLTAAGAWLSPG